MIIMRIHSGLGNQLFQYAVAWALSKRLKQPFALYVKESVADRAFRLNRLNVCVKTVIKSEEMPPEFEVINNRHVNDALRKLDVTQYQIGNWLYFQQLVHGFQREILTVNAENVYLDGYFQCEGYFREYKMDLVRQFTPSYSVEPDYVRTLVQIQNCNSVAVHVRRGDFCLSSHPYHYLLPETYYRKAITYIRERIESPVFFWFSEDYEWIYNTFGHEKDFIFAGVPSENGDINDLMLMKHCKHIITANSTFSWWAAWLNEQEDTIRIVPEKQYITDGSIPDFWIKLPV